MTRRLLSPIILLWALPLAAQDVPNNHPAIRNALEQIQATNEQTLAQQIALCEIPAPPFGEARRAASFRSLLEAEGLTNIRIDEEGNVIAERPGTGPGPRVFLTAHLDTVFPEGTDVTVTRVGTRLSGPGIGDDCRGLATVLAVVRAYRTADVRTTGTLVVVGTVGEEGPGNLRGVRHLFDKASAGPIDYFISVDGVGLGTTTRAVGSHRYRVTFRGPGGHSYGAFGMPNPIHALGRAIAGLADLPIPPGPKATYSVGVITGGTSVNSIAMEASMEVDLRSESQSSLDRLDADFQHAVHQALTEERARWKGSAVPLEVDVTSIGKRPAGGQPDTAPIVVTATRAARALGFTTELGASSTDANIAISRGVPALTVDGGGTGGGAHSVSEWYDDGERGYLGPQWVALIVAALLGVR